MDGATDQISESTQASPDDWRSITDRKVKKRIQNRVAQRTYRSRLKQRLEDLQQQVDEHERRQVEDSGPSPAREGHRARDSLSHSASGSSPDQDIDRINLGNLHNHPSYGTQNGHRHGSQDSRHMDDFMWHGHGMSAAPSSSMDLAGLNLEATAHPHHKDSWGIPPSGLMPEMFHTSPALYHPDASHTMQQNGRPNGYAMFANRDMPNGDYMNNAPVQIPTPASSDFAPSRCPTAIDEFLWKNRVPLDMNEGDPNARLNSSSLSPAHGGDNASRRSGSVSQASVMLDDMEDIPGVDAPVEERFDYLLSCARKVGFESFDAMLGQFYALDFDQASQLALEQRLSRNRRLPTLLAELRNQSGRWTQWERRGYQDEVLKCAEDICAVECAEFALRDDIGQTKVTAEGLRHMFITEKSLQDRLPNLWALLTGFTSSNPMFRHKNRSQAVFASMLLLCGLGSIQSQQSSQPHAASRTPVDAGKDAN